MQGTEVIGVSQFAAQLLEDFPVQRGAGFAKFAFEVCGQVFLDTVVVQERVIHVEQKYQILLGAHAA